MKKLIENLTLLINDYNLKNNCAIEKIKVSTHKVKNTFEKKITGYNLTIVVNSL